LPRRGERLLNLPIIPATLVNIEIRVRVDAAKNTAYCGIAAYGDIVVCGQSRIGKKGTHPSSVTDALRKYR
jgi:hypothetical protein